jgi:DNA polymerase-3 subunit chi
MADVAFYHLQTKRLEDALPQLLEKAVERGLRALVLADSAERVASLNTLLWTFKREGFLPHGDKADGHAEAQPIFLTEAETNPNGATLLFAVGGARLEYVAGFQRCFDLFDGNDELAVAAARERWKAAKAAGHQLTYWQQTERGGWEKKTEA